MIVELKRGVKPFRFSKFGYKWRLFDGADIPQKVYVLLKHKLKRSKEKDGK